MTISIIPIQYAHTISTPMAYVYMYAFRHTHLHMQLESSFVNNRKRSETLSNNKIVSNSYWWKWRNENKYEIYTNQQVRMICILGSWGNSLMISVGHWQPENTKKNLICVCTMCCLVIILRNASVYSLDPFYPTTIPPSYPWRETFYF